jgi:thiol:disulfide interchange protein DsbD
MLSTLMIAVLAIAMPVSAQTVDSANQIARLFAEQGTVLALAAIFVIGLALNLTPCVYPMLSVTVSIFGAQTDTRPARVFFKALVYVLGIATMYSVLGVVAALTGGLFGGLMQSPWVLATIAALLLALALSMFGLYELRPPAALMSRYGGATTAGLAGTYLSGLLVGIFAAPCIGPPIIALLALVGAKGDPWFGFGSFFILALGLGAPYLVLGTFSGLLKRLPKSGAWMEWVKKLFGVVLVGVAAFYFALGFAPGAVKWIPVVTLVLGGVYLGFAERTGNDRPMFRRVKWAVGALAVVGGVAMLATEPKTKLDWQSYQPEKLAAAKAAGQRVVMDFYADWCIPCHELDRRTFSHPDVIAALAGHVKLKVDLTRMDSPESQALVEQYRIQGVPTVIFLDANGRERPAARVLGFLSPQEFLEQANLKPSNQRAPR